MFLKEHMIKLFLIITILYCRCGFAQSQQAYDKAVNELFNTLDMLDAHLSSSRYLCGDVLTLADICLFTTLIRFDLVYNVLFKCTKKKLQEYTHLHAYMREIYQVNLQFTTLVAYVRWVISLIIRIVGFSQQCSCLLQ